MIPTDRFNNLMCDQRLLNDETVLELKLLTEKYPWFQLGWMVYLKNLKQIESPEYQSVLKKVAVRGPNRKQLYNYLNSDFQKKPDKIEFENPMHVFDEFEPETENSNGNSLIDKFLLTKPGAIKKVSGDENSQESENRLGIIEKSTAENDDLITETLAAIYFQQKNFGKALDAYKKLSLKYPEKSSYFATCISDLEKNIE